MEIFAPAVDGNNSNAYYRVVNQMLMLEDKNIKLSQLKRVLHVLSNKWEKEIDKVIGQGEN